jgi:hypothetical protein
VVDDMKAMTALRCSFQVAMKEKEEDEDEERTKRGTRRDTDICISKK